MKYIYIIFLKLVILFSYNGYAQKIEEIFYDWNVLSTLEEGKKICYIASLPVSQEGSITDEHSSYFLVSLFPERSPEISFSPGFELLGNSKVKIDIDGQTAFLNKIVGKIAWSETSNEDQQIIKSLKKGIKLKVLSTNLNGKFAFDIFSLKGFTAAYNKMMTLCN